MSNYIDMHQLEKKMRPGLLSEQGFLGANESLELVLAEDTAFLNRLGITHDEIASTIETVLSIVVGRKREDLKDWLEKATSFPRLSEPESIPHFSVNNLPNLDQGFLVGKLHVFIVQWRGFQACPWGCTVNTKWASIDFMILNRESGEYFTGPGLAIHLIREHQFFEGKETPFRVDPEKAIRVLEIPHQS